MPFSDVVPILVVVVDGEGDDLVSFKSRWGAAVFPRDSCDKVQSRQILASHTERARLHASERPFFRLCTVRSGSRSWHQHAASRPDGVIPDRLPTRLWPPSTFATHHHLIHARSSNDGKRTHQHGAQQLLRRKQVCCRRCKQGPVQVWKQGMHSHCALRVLLFQG